MNKMTIDADKLYYRELNQRIREAVASGTREFELTNVRGQRYIAGALEGKLRFLIHGTPGQDLGSFMRGPHVRVEGNAQDGVGNTMDEGAIRINGMAGDVIGYAMRGGSVYVKGDVGYRVGIHMKAYKDKFPVIVAGGKAGDFLGEYMAGGAIILLGMFSGKTEAPIAGRTLGAGMHGGAVYIRGGVDERQLGPGLHAEPADEADMELIKMHVEAFANEFALDAAAILSQPFVRVKPFSHRPYGNMYVPT